MPFTKEQTEKLNNFLDTTLIDWNGVDYHRLENWICDLLQAQTSSYRAAIEKMKYKRGFFEIDPQPSSHLGYYNRAIDQVLNLFTEGKV